MGIAAGGHSAPGEKPKLLVLASTYPRWAGDHEPGFVHELCRRLTDRFDVFFLGPHAPGASRNETLDGVKIRRFRYAPAALETLVNDGGIVTNLRRQPWKWLLVPAFLVALGYSTWRELNRLQPDVVHAHWLLPQGLVMAVLSSLRQAPPFLVTSHGADLFALRGSVFVALKRFVVRRAAALTVVSQAMVDGLRRIGAGSRKLLVRPMGVDLKHRFTPDGSVDRSLDEILFVGRLVEKKGLRYLIDALPKILRDYPNARLTVAGYGPAEQDLRQQVHNLGLEDHVCFVGSVVQEQLPELYRRAAVFVAPFVEAVSGDQEGLGLVTVEAIGCGCPAIVSAVGATRGLPAQKVPPENSDAIATAVVEILGRDPKERDAEAARQRMGIEQFDWQAVAAAYGELLLSQVPGNQS